MKGQWWINAQSGNWCVLISPAHFVPEGKETTLCGNRKPVGIFARTIDPDGKEAKYYSVRICKSCGKKISGNPRLPRNNWIGYL